MHLNEYAACFNLNRVKKKKHFYQTQYVAAGVDSAVHRHKLVCVGNTVAFIKFG